MGGSAAHGELVALGAVKGLILSGGKGTRLRPITHTGAKQLVPIANKPVLFYGLEALVEAGIEEVGIVVGDTAEEIRRAVGDGSRFGARVEYIPQDQPLGLAHAVKISRSFLGDSPFVMYLGDNFITGGISAVVEQFIEEGPEVLILLKQMPDPQRFGVAELEGVGSSASRRSRSTPGPIWCWSGSTASNQASLRQWMPSHLRRVESWR